LSLLFVLWIPASFAAPAETESETVQAKSDAGEVSDKSLADPELRRERQIGREAARRIEKDWELSADPALLARLSMIAERLKPHFERDIPYEVRIVRMSAPNAFCLPGGFIFFTDAMLDSLHSDAEIAAVMAHEMAHADRRHGMKMAAKSSRLSLAALAVIVASGGAMAPAVLAQVAQIAATSAYTVEFEKEADSVGLDALIAAGYPPAAMVTVMEGFMHDEIRKPAREYGIYMNHPESVGRVESLSEKLRLSGVRLERKYPLQLLRTEVSGEGGRLRLLVDGVEMWGGAESDFAREALARAQAALDRDFQMELAPYDLRLENGVLRLKNAVVARAPLPEDMKNLSAFRENLLSALERARRKRPVTKYFR
jgi:predicted Zn-dependent protease